MYITFHTSVTRRQRTKLPLIHLNFFLRKNSMKQKVNSYQRYFWTCSQCDHFYFKPPEKIIFSQKNNTPSDFYLDFLLSKMIWHKDVSKPVNISGRITHKLHVLKMKNQDSSSGIKA